MGDATMANDVVARLEALTARLDEQAERIAGLEAENARLRVTVTAPTTTDAAEPKVGRRGMLRMVAGATGAAALLTVSKEAATAEAAANATLNAGSTAQYGVAASPGTAGAPSIPPLGSTTHGVIGSNLSSGGFFQPTVGSGVFGVRSGSNLVGVLGVNDLGTGVYGKSQNTTGVQGVSTNNAGVYGQGPIGVFATGTGVAAVYGANNAGYGVWGQSSSHIGVRGESVSNVAVQAFSTNHWGLHAKSSTYAGVFEGDVYITGRVTAVGGVGDAASAAGASAARTMVEDIGEATLVNGKATVPLGASFVEEVKRGQYHVFVTPHDASVRGLAVVARRRDGFDVHELAGGPTDAGGAARRVGHGTFSYRAVARLAAPTAADHMPPAPPDFSTAAPAPRRPEPPAPPDPSGPTDERP
jgi:hypothetical protein